MKDVAKVIAALAREIQGDLSRARHPVSTQVALASAEAHFNESKRAASAILVSAGVPMVERIAEGDGTRIKTRYWDCGKVTVFIGC